MGGYDWMRIALATAFDRYAPAEAIRCLQDEAALRTLRAEVERQLLDSGSSECIPPGAYGDNLLQAILTLRVKFPREQATEKLELNIAMRARAR